MHTSKMLPNGSAAYNDAYSTNFGCVGDECINNFSYTLNHSNYNNTWTDPKLVCVMDDFLERTDFVSLVTVMYGSVFSISLTGNALVCFTVCLIPSMKTVTNYFIVNLAIGDLLLTLLCVPPTFVSMLLLRYWPFGLLMCRVVNYSQAVAVLVSAYTMVAIAIDRYLHIIHPLRPRVGMTTAKLIVAAVWVSALITAAPILVVSTLQKPSLWHEVCHVHACGENWPNSEQMEQYTYALLGLQFAFPLTILVYTYAHIAYVVWSERPPGEAEASRDARMLVSKKKMVVMMTTIVLLFILCWFPLNVFLIIWANYGAEESWSTWPGTEILWLASHWLAMSHSCYNPIIYCFMNTNFRNGFKQLLRM